MPDYQDPNYIWKCFDACDGWEHRKVCRWAHGLDLRHVNLDQFMDGRNIIYLNAYCPATGRIRNEISLKDPVVAGEPYENRQD